MSFQNESYPEEEGFEGPEKNLQIIFNKIDYNTGTETLRSINKERWQEMLNFAKCKILSTLENEKWISYILSESSLFVYDDRIILKTCGTTTILNALDDIILIGKELNLKPAVILYWRKNFSNPHLQHVVHQSFENEVHYLDEHLGADSRSATLGSQEKDHFFFYYCELLNKNEFNPVFETFEIKMHEIHPNIAEKFFWKNGNVRNKSLNDIYDRLPGYKIDEFFFKPCGYSMNGIKNEKYETIHVTPEGGCSYISFETNDKEFINTEDKEKIIIDCLNPFSFSTIQIKGNNSTENVKKDINRNYNLISTDFANLGSINIKFHYYETNETHPMTFVAKRRLEKISLKKDIKSLKVS